MKLSSLFSKEKNIRKQDYKRNNLPATPRQKFFDCITNRYRELFKLNVLITLFMIPMFVWVPMNILILLAASSVSNAFVSALISTAGSGIWLILISPFICSAGYAGRQWVEGNSTYDFREFWRVARDNWKQSALLMLFYVCCTLVFIFLITYFQGDTMLFICVRILYTIVYSLIILTSLFSFQMISAYNLSIFNTIKNSFIFVVLSFKFVALCVVLIALPVSLLLLTGMLIGIGLLIGLLGAYFVVFGFSFSALVSATLSNYVFTKYFSNTKA